MARARLDRSFWSEDACRICPLRRRAQIRFAKRQDRRSQIVSVWRSPQGCHKTVAMQGVWDGVHAGNAAWRAYGIFRRRLLRLLSVRRNETVAQGSSDRGCGMNIAPFVYKRPRGKVHVPTVTLAHGGGGKAMKDLIDDVFLTAFDNPLLAPLDDQARLDLATLAKRGNRIAFTTDSFVVDPLVFPGGDIGKLAVCGTINDLAVGGAIPLYLSCAAIIEEGLPFDLLGRMARSMAVAAYEAGVLVVTGDTKVVPRGA